MTSSVPNEKNTAAPYTQHRNYKCPNDFSLIQNKKNKCNKTETILCNPTIGIPATSLTQSGNLFNNGAFKKVTSNPGYTYAPNVADYYYISLFDAFGKSGSLTFNRVRIFYLSTAGATNVRAAIYRLEAAATLGDNTTYQGAGTNSSLVVESAAPTAIAASATGNFVDIVVPETTLPSFTGTTQNQYFLAIKSDAAFMPLMISNPVFVGTSTSLGGYIYRSNVAAAGAFNNTLQVAQVGSPDPIAMIYYLLWRDV